MNNVHRMLERYRTGLYGLSPETKFVHNSIERVVTAVFPNQPQEESIIFIRDVLRELICPNKFKNPSKGARDKAKYFFGQLYEGMRG